MTEIDLIYDVDCLNADQARINLRRALEKARLPTRWREWIGTAPTTPQQLRRFGSPTILVDGRDVAGGQPLDGTGACRMYQDENLRRQGVPAVSMILAALAGKPEESASPRARPGVPNTLAVVPGTLAAFLPALSCPACWPAYAGLLSSLGIGFLWQGPYLLPITVVLLAIALAALGYGARQRGGYGPLVLGSVGSVAMLLAKFVLHRPWIATSAAGLILAASVWNAWPKRMARRSCPACEDLTAQIRGAACPSCQIDAFDMRSPEGAARARREGIQSVPAVIIDGQVASCCAGRGPGLATLGQLGLGQPR